MNFELSALPILNYSILSFEFPIHNSSTPHRVSDNSCSGKRLYEPSAKLLIQNSKLHSNSPLLVSVPRPRRSNGDRDGRVGIQR